jgi:hypothetical protein
VEAFQGWISDIKEYLSETKSENVDEGPRKEIE